LGFAIEAAHDDGVRRFAGSVSLRPHGAGIAEIAYGLHPAARGARVCSRAVKLLLDWGFQQPEIDVVTWYAYVGNWASRRVAWANGFSIDGTLAKFLSQRGVRKDTWIGTLRAEDSREPKTPWHVPPVLETERLRLRPNRESDAERFGEMIFDERARHFNGRVKHLEKLADGAAVIRRNLDFEARGERFNWSVADRGTDELVGHVQLFDLVGTDDSEAKLGYVVHPAWRGRGVVTETLGAVVEWAFRPVEGGGLGKRRLSLTTAASNKASRYAAEQVGFVHIATEPEAFTTGESGFDDSVTYHQLNPHWTS
jgi:RimJ/RimL family protein N-acetyltransferase